MPNMKRFFLKLTTLFLIFFIHIAFFFNVGVKAQTNQPAILIPLENLTFSPSRNEFVLPGSTDLVVTLNDFQPISNNSICKFSFNQIQQTPTGEVFTSEFFEQSVYQNSFCRGTLPAARQLSANIRIGIEVISPDGQRFASFVNYFVFSDIEIADPENFTLPYELYLKPEINIILEKDQLRVRDKIKVQAEVTNRDNFAIKELSVKISIPERIGRIDCDSLKFTDEKLNGRIIFFPLKNFDSIPVSAQASNEGDEARCVDDQYTFELNLATLAPKKTTRLNFDIDIQRAGKLRFEITTNLDQGRISKVTESILVIQPQGVQPFLPRWAWLLIFGSVAVIIAFLLVFFLRKKFKTKKSHPINRDENS